MEDHVEKFRQADALAQNILRLTRNTLLRLPCKIWSRCEVSASNFNADASSTA